ncbi:hypothetical protein D3C80_1478540 [compost metagenome]
MDADALEGAGRGVLALLPGRIGDRQHGSQVRCPFERLLGTALHHGTGHALGETLFAVLLEHPGDFLFAGAGDPLRRTDATRRVHAHVQRAVIEEAESALGIVQLRRGNAQVQQDPADLACQAADSDFFAKFRKTALHNDKAAVFGR